MSVVGPARCSRISLRPRGYDLRWLALIRAGLAPPPCSGPKLALLLDFDALPP